MEGSEVMSSSSQVLMMRCAIDNGVSRDNY